MMERYRRWGNKPCDFPPGHLSRFLVQEEARELLSGIQVTVEQKEKCLPVIMLSMLVSHIITLDLDSQVKSTKAAPLPLKKCYI